MKAIVNLKPTELVTSQAEPDPLCPEEVRQDMRGGTVREIGMQLTSKFKIYSLIAFQSLVQSRPSYPVVPPLLSA